jgi:hypothetical protein
MNKGVCKDIYGGIYGIWRAMFFCVFFFLLLSITGSLLYQYFGWKEIEAQGQDPPANAVTIVAPAAVVEIEMSKPKEKEIDVCLSEQQEQQVVIPNDSLVEKEKPLEGGEKI